MIEKLYECAASGMPMGSWVSPECPQSAEALRLSLDTLDISLEIWDRQNQLVWHSMGSNNPWPDFRGACASIGDGNGLPPSQSQAAHVCAARDGGLKSIQRRFLRQANGKPTLEHLPGDRWIKTFEAHAPDGHLLVVRVNVTELMRQGRQLESSNRQLNEMSVTDSLTGLANRRSLDEVLLEEWHRAMRNQSDLALVMVDIDHFKKYNDYYGHLAGDASLRRVAAVLRRCTRRAGELAARYGGEEFVMLLPGSNREHAVEVAELCMRLMEQEGIPHDVSPSASVLTVSSGVACLQDHVASSATDLINASDAAMYRAKMAGRACYEVATTMDWEIDPQSPRTNPALLHNELSAAY